MHKKAIIFGIKSFNLTSKEKKLFRRYKPWGIILFSRNIKNLSQAKKLVINIRKIFKDKKYPILIDQEGGKVSRLNKIIDLSCFSQNYFGNLYKKDKNLFLNYYKIYVDATSSLLKSIGVNINTVPVLDVRRKSSHSIIGSRSFSSIPKDVSLLGNICISFYKKNNLATVIKHAPGHGLSKVDSHNKKPIINSSKKNLMQYDFQPFKSSASLFAMTAHVVYPVYDPINTATHSKIIINKVIRKYINFKGILISDDISMKALKYNLEENALRAIRAGCNLILHCNGNIKEMLKLTKVIPNIDKFTQKKTSHFYKFLR